MADRANNILFGRQEARYAEGRRLAEAAWAGGHAEAGSLLSAYLMHGLGGPADAERAKRILTESAGKGSIGANLTLSQAYETGNRLFRRDARAAYRHALAAAQAAGPLNAQGRALGQYRVGMLTLRGVGVSKDAERAYAWVSQASEGGHADAMISRAVMLASGEGVARDAAVARGWYARAALAPGGNYAHALRGLGGMLAMGEGGPIDLDRATAYLSVAKAGRDEYADRVIEMLRPRLATSDGAKVRAVIADWRNDVRRFLPPTS